MAMTLRALLSYGAAFALLAAPGGAAPADVFKFVNPLIGTSNGGHVFPGATLPFGMAKAGPDSVNDNEGGFATDGGPITGFSHMHDDGTGGSPSLGNFPLFPYASCPGDNYKQCAYSKQQRPVNPITGSAKASPGYFTVKTATNIVAEMTVSNHTALYRFTFPANPTNGEPLSPLILSDLTDLPDSFSGGSIKIDPTTARMTGNGTFNPSFGVGNYKLNFCADFKGATIRDSGIWTNNVPSNTTSSAFNIDSEAGAWVQFNKPTANNQIFARVGVSFISVDKACQNAETEIPNFSFAATRKVATAAWMDKFSVVDIDPGGASDVLQTVFWSGLYRSMISPQDYTGENPLWNSTEPYYDSYYCIWDSFRSIHPLITLVDPYSQSRMVRSLIDIYVHEGWLPDCRMSLCKGFTQGGSNADVVLVDSYLKGIEADWQTGYQALIKDAENEPFDWGEEGRGNLQSWHTVGYIPKDDPTTKGNGLETRSISRTVEYGYNDFCIATMAQRMNLTDDYNKYTNRSRNWRHLFKANQRSKVNGKDSGFSGFLQPKFLKGAWAKQNPTLCSPLNDFTGCYLNAQGHETYEGSCWLYTFFVPGDMASLIKTLGGPKTFIKRVTFFHDSGLLYIGDEQAFLTVFLYHYGARPALSAARAHTYIPSQFNATFDGIPGNDDSGAMGSFSTLTMLGIFPNAGQDVYFITPPFFRSVSITNPQTGKVAQIKNINFDPSYKAIYIQKATLNGQPYTKNWLSHSFFLNGGVLELTLGTQESDWGTAAADLPPSLSTTGIAP